MVAVVKNIDEYTITGASWECFSSVCNYRGDAPTLIALYPTRCWLVQSLPATTLLDNPAMHRVSTEFKVPCMYISLIRKYHMILHEIEFQDWRKSLRK